jgi:hypothetical protein
LFIGNALFHLEAIAHVGNGHGTRLGIAAIVMLIMLIGGRVIPSFTRNWLARRGPGRLPASFDLGYYREWLQSEYIEGGKFKTYLSRSKGRTTTINGAACHQRAGARSDRRSAELKRRTQWAPLPLQEKL